METVRMKRQHSSIICKPNNSLASVGTLLYLKNEISSFLKSLGDLLRMKPQFPRSHHFRNSSIKLGTPLRFVINDEEAVDSDALGRE